MISVTQLKAAIFERIAIYNHDDHPPKQRATRTLALLSSQRHILATDIRAPFAIPRQPVSAMDGYAIAKDSDLDMGSVIDIVGTAKAGSPYEGCLRAGQGVRIATGAVIPEACDTVVMQENVDVNHAPAKMTTATNAQVSCVTLAKAATCGANIRRAGEEITQDETVLRCGKRINTSDIGLLASLGIDKVAVIEPLKVGLLATGDELVTLGEPLENAAHIYDANTPTLHSLLAALPVRIYDFGIAPDNLEQTAQTVKAAMQQCDVLISTAGVSVGDYDFLTTVIEQLGRITHHKVAMKPGKPFVFGELSQGMAVPVLYFGLPGNPLAALVGALQFVIPALWQLSGADAREQPPTLTLQATLTADTKKSVGRTDFQRGILSRASDGRYQVDCSASQQSHRIKQLSRANCLVIFEPERGDACAGETVTVQPFPWLFH